MLEVQLHEIVDEVFPHLVPSPINVAVPASGAAPVLMRGNSIRVSDSLSSETSSLEPIRSWVSFLSPLPARPNAEDRGKPG
jgi:hypothetical protein